VNIAYFLLPKSRVAYLYDDHTFRQGLEKMRHHGYTAIPVITRSGRYIGTVSEGDFLWRLLSGGSDHPQARSMKDLEHLLVKDMLHDDNYPPVRITVGMEELLIIGLILFLLYESASCEDRGDIDETVILLGLLLLLG